MKLYLLNAAFQDLNIPLPEQSGLNLLVGQITDLHGIVYLQRNGTDIRAVERFADDTAANGISVQPDEQIEQSGTVTYLNVLFAVQRAEDLLGEVKGIVFALLIGKAWIGFQVLQRQGRGLEVLTNTWGFAVNNSVKFRSCSRMTLRRMVSLSWFR